LSGLSDNSFGGQQCKPEASLERGQAKDAGQTLDVRSRWSGLCEMVLTFKAE